MTLPLRADDLGNNVAGFAAARTEIEDRFAGMDVARRIAAAVVLFDNLVRNDFEQSFVITHRQTQTGFDFLGGVAIALQHRRFMSVGPLVR